MASRSPKWFQVKSESSLSGSSSCAATRARGWRAGTRSAEALGSGRATSDQAPASRTSWCPWNGRSARSIASTRKPL